VVDKADALSKKTFGITQKDTYYVYPRRYHELAENSWERDKFKVEFDRNEAKFTVLEDADENIAKWFLLHNVDFRDSYGRPLRCISLFKRQALAAVTGIKGFLPSIHEIKNQNWTNNLEKDVQNFMATRKR
jgi:hypothetical protein